MKLLAFVVVLSACSDLPVFEAVCGNFQIDPTEDCDDTTDACVECRLVCQDGGGCYDLPGYRCGADNYCHAPSGVLARTYTEQPTEATDFHVGDVDRDLYNDVIALSGTSILVAYGDDTAELGVQDSFVIPPHGRAVFQDIDGDTVDDAITPTADGIAAYSAKYFALAPHAFIQDIGNPSDCSPQTQLGGQPFHVFPLDGDHIGLLVVRPTGRIGTAVIDARNQSICADVGTVLPTCNIELSLDEQGAIGFAIYDTSLSKTEGSAVVAVTTNPTNPTKTRGTCVINFARSGDSFTTTRVFERFGLVERLTLADLDGTGCPSLIAEGGVEHVAAGAPGTCDLVDMPTTIDLPADAIPVAGVPIDPFVEPPLGGPFGADALVTDAGVYAVRRSRTGTVELYRSDRPLTAASSADFDGDSDLDIITAGQGSEDIDILTRSFGDSFVRYRIDSFGPITFYSVADFDGNEIKDLAFVEIEGTRQRVHVAYGTRDGLLAPTDLGLYAQVVGLVPVQLEDSSDQNLEVDDLMVLDLVDPSMATPVLTLLHGSPQRTMQSFMDPRRGVVIGENDPNRTFTGVAVGDFFAPAFVDMFAIETTGLRSLLYPLFGVGTNTLSYSQSIQTPLDPASTLGTCRSGTLDVQYAFCTNAATYVTWPREPSNDLVIGVDEDEPRHVVIIDPVTPGVAGGAGPQAMITYSELPVTVDAQYMVQALRVANLDGVDPPELVLAFRPRDPMATSGGVTIVCDVDATNRRLVECFDLGAHLALDMGCVDATIAKLAPGGRNAPAPSGADELVLACQYEATIPNPNPQDPRPTVAIPRTELVRVHLDEQGYHATMLGRLDGTTIRLVAGDVSGDGVDDIVGLKVLNGTRYLYVFPQCASTDIECAKREEESR